MSTREDRIRFRRRTPWEAADLGARLITEHLWFYNALWFCTMLPWYLIVTVLFYNHPIWAFYLLWWSKPAFEAGIVMVLSVQVFGDMPPFAHSVKQSWRALLRPRIIGDLLWRRLSLRRTLILPITVLEKVRGAQHARRSLEVGRKNSVQLSWITLFGVHFEAILLYGILMIIGWMLLRDFSAELAPPSSKYSILTNVGDYFSWLARSEANGIWHLLNALYLVILSFWEPFFVAMGFTLYLQARTESEAWDIRLTFRRLAERLGKGAAAILLALLLGGVSGISPVRAETPPDPAHVNQVREETVGSAPFIHLQTRDRYCYQTCDKQTPPPQAPLKDTKPAPWLLIAYWVLGLLAVTLVLYSLWFWYRHRTAKSTTTQLPERLFGLDIREESLPDCVSAAARALFADNPRAALALLYRALLVQLLQGGQLLFKASTTEGEIVRLVAQTRPALNLITENITRAWVYMAYAHLPPTAEKFNALCAQYAAAFESTQPPEMHHE